MNNITNTLKSAKKDLESIGKLLEPVDAGSEDIEQKSGQSTKIVQLVLSGGIDIFLNQFNEPYIALPDSSFIAEPLSSKKTEALLFKLFWDKYGKVPGQKAVSDAINLLRGHVLFSNQRHREVHNRIGRYGEILYYDLGDNPASCGWYAGQTARLASGLRAELAQQVAIHNPAMLFTQLGAAAAYGLGDFI